MGDAYKELKKLAYAEFKREWEEAESLRKWQIKQAEVECVDKLRMRLIDVIMNTIRRS